jgi:hypothetical protein
MHTPFGVCERAMPKDSFSRILKEISIIDGTLFDDSLPFRRQKLLILDDLFCCCEFSATLSMLSLTITTLEGRVVLGLDGVTMVL